MSANSQDAVDIATVGLRQLRGAIAVLPQSPCFFAGTCRQNLDPFGRHTDAELWRGLERVSMAAALRGRGGLGADVAEGGAAFSAGQQQLLCLARMLFTRSQTGLRGH